MAGKQKQLTSEQMEWIERLERNQWDAPDLSMAQELTAARPVPQKLPDVAHKQLRNRLLQRHPQSSTVGYQWLRWRGTLAYAPLYLLLLIVGAWLFRTTLPVANQASNPLQTSTPIIQAVQSTSTQTASTQTVLSESWEIEFRPDYFNADVMTQGTIQSWSQPDGTSYRYLIQDQDGKISFFEQRNRDTWWYSRPTPNTMQKQWVIKQTDPALAGQSLAWHDISWVLNLSPVESWPRIDRLLKEHRAQCNDLFCLLGIRDVANHWTCQADSCIRTIFGEQAMRASLKSNANDPALLHVVVEGFNGEGNHAEMIFQKETLQLVELALKSYDEADRRYTLRKKATATQTVSARFFQELPAQLVEVKETMPTQMAMIRYKLQSITPAPNSRLEPPDKIQFHVVYENSNYVPGLRFVAYLWPIGKFRPATIHEIEDRQEFPILEAQGSFTGTLLILSKRYYSGRWEMFIETPMLPSFRTELFNRLLWCVQCQMSDFLNIEMQGFAYAPDTYQSGQGVFWIKGLTTAPDGTCLDSQLLLDGQPASWWQPKACATVTQGTWKISVPLSQEVVKGAALTQNIYRLRIWDHPKQRPSEELDLAGGFFLPFVGESR